MTAMKKITFIICLVLTIPFIGCEDQLDQQPLSNLGFDNFYRTQADMIQAVNGTYRALSGYDVRLLELSEVRSDNVYVALAGPRDYVPVHNFMATLATNAYMSTAWNNNYQGILRANLVMEKLNETIVPNETLRNRMMGEVKFLRAFFYFDLIRLFGKVPLVTRPLVTSEDREEALLLDRSPVSEVYDLIIADLTDAIALLPGTYTGADRGRVTSHAARGILALVHLTRSGPHYGIDGPGLGVSEYSQALTLLNQIIDSKQFSLLPSYAGVFSYSNEYNSEVIFSLQAFDPTGEIDQGVGTTLPSEWYEANYGQAVSIGFAGGVVSDAPKEPSRNLINSFEANDVRDNFSILPSYVYLGNTVNRPQFVKFLDLAEKPTARFSFPINFPVLRYADILLMKAETIIRSAGPSSESDDLINQIRTRANLGPIAGATLSDLLTESRHEFVSEGRRWHELVRTGEVLNVMNAWIVAEDDVRANHVNTVTANHIIYPIPQAERAVNPLLEQNPGYN